MDQSSDARTMKRISLTAFLTPTRNCLTPFRNCKNNNNQICFSRIGLNRCQNCRFRCLPLRISRIWTSPWKIDSVTYLRLGSIPAKATVPGSCMYFTKSFDLNRVCLKLWWARNAISCAKRIFLSLFLWSTWMESFAAITEPTWRAKI